MEFINLPCYTGIFLVVAHRFVVPSYHLQNYKHLLEYFGLYLLTTVYTKKLYEEFLFLFICEVTMTKVNFRFHKQCSQAGARLFCKLAIFALNASSTF